MKKGFTLIELMVSVSIFSIVMVVSLGALLSISAAERKAETLKSVMSNLNFALDSMSRSIRTGVNYSCNPTVPIVGIPVPADCASGASVIGFQAVEASLPLCAVGSPCIVVYCRGNGSTCNSSGTSLLRSINGGTFLPITASEVTVTNLTFYVTGACPVSGTGGCTSDAIQPKVVITLNGTIPVTNGQQSDFKIQTSVTQRIYDQ